MSIEKIYEQLSLLDLSKTVDIIIVYDSKGNTLCKDLRFANVLDILNDNVTIKELQSHPAVIFSVISAEKGAVVPNTMDIYDDYHTTLSLKRIKLNQYQDWEINKDIKISYLNFSKCFSTGSSLTDFLSSVEKLKHKNHTRHPQLRRILKFYYDKIYVNFNEEVLFDTLSQNNDNTDCQWSTYQYYDADELFLYNMKWFKGTLFEKIPIEIKHKIINHINNNPINKDINVVPKPTVINDFVKKMAGDIVNGEFDNNEPNIMELFNRYQEEGLFTKIKDDIIREQGEDIDIYRYITNILGFNNILNHFKILKKD